jgi:hypothetical protein
MDPYAEYNDNNWQEFRRRMDHQGTLLSANIVISPIGWEPQSNALACPDTQTYLASDDTHSTVGHPFYASQPMTIYPVEYASQSGSNNGMSELSPLD